MNPLVWSIIEAIVGEYLCPALCVLAVLACVVFIIVDHFWNRPRD